MNECVCTKRVKSLRECVLLTWAQRVKDPSAPDPWNGKASETDSEVAKPSSGQCENVGHVYKHQQLPAPRQRLPTRTKACWARPTGFSCLGCSSRQTGSSVEHSFSESGPWGRGPLPQLLGSSPLCWLTSPLMLCFIICLLIDRPQGARTSISSILKSPQLLTMKFKNP